MLVTPERITSAAEGRARLAFAESTEDAADRMQKLVMLSVPFIRMVARGARFTRVPWVLIASSAITSGLTMRTGVREIQVLASLLAYRIEEATGLPADPALVKKLAVELYLAPKQVPDVSNRRLRLDRLVRRWLFRGVLGRKTGKAASKALDAAERLDLEPLLARWAT